MWRCRVGARVRNMRRSCEQEVCAGGVSEQVRACAARSFSEAAVVAGHFRADQLREEHVSANQTCFYMLRDPISRLASQYAMGMLAGRGRRFLPTPFAQLPPRDMLYLRGFSGDLAQLISGKLHGQAEARRRDSHDWLSDDALHHPLCRPHRATALAHLACPANLGSVGHTRRALHPGCAAQPDAGRDPAHGSL